MDVHNHNPHRGPLRDGRCLERTLPDGTRRGVCLDDADCRTCLGINPTACTACGHRYAQAEVRTADLDSLRLLELVDRQAAVIDAVNAALREAGIDHPLGAQGVEDLASQRDGRADDQDAVIQAVRDLADKYTDASGHPRADVPVAEILTALRGNTNDVERAAR